MALLVNCVNKTNCHSPSLPHSFIPSLPLNIVLSIFPSSHPFLFQLLYSSPSLFFSLSYSFFPFPSHLLFLAHPFFLSRPLPFPFSISLPDSRFLAHPFSFCLAITLLSSHLVILPLSLEPSLFLPSLSLFKNC